MDLTSDLKMAQMIAERVRDCGGRTYFVGGYVRDRFLNIENKDIERVESVLRNHILKPVHNWRETHKNYFC